MHCDIYALITRGFSGQPHVRLAQCSSYESSLLRAAFLGQAGRLFERHLAVRFPFAASCKPFIQLFNAPPCSVGIQQLKTALDSATKIYRTSAFFLPGIICRYTFLDIFRRTVFSSLAAGVFPLITQPWTSPERQHSLEF